MGPSMTMGASMPLRRRPAAKVVVFQCPCGRLALSRSPLGVEIGLFLEPGAPCLGDALSRLLVRMARLFFERPTVAGEESPHCHARHLDPAFVAEPCAHFVQRDVRLLVDKVEQKRLVGSRIERFG